MIVGKPEVVRVALVALLAEGHLLVEDVPGVGKTTLAKALARSIDGSVSRVQFTPDLLPVDITGLSIFNRQSAEFEFRPGPVFANIVIADEINRASPKTQSALLECMEERQVTVDGATYALASPFLVVATQNPVEMDGTYPLPEAQRDRFTGPRLRRLPGPRLPSSPCSTSTPRPTRSTRCARSPTPATSTRPSRPCATCTSAPRCASTASRSSARRGGCRSCASARRRGPRCSWCARRARRPRWPGAASWCPTTCSAVAVPVLAHRLLLTPDAQAARRSPVDIVRALVARTPVPAPARPAG